MYARGRLGDTRTAPSKVEIFTEDLPKLRENNPVGAAK